MWTIDVELADHDAVKNGIICQRVSRVHLSTADFPDPVDAEIVAALFASTVHQQFPMPTSVSHCL